MHTFALALLSCVVSLHASPPEVLRLWGQVRDAGGGVPCALVVAVGQDSCLTDEHGNYAFDRLPMGPCHLLVRAPGHETLRMRFWLRREAFLPIELAARATLAAGFAEDSLRLIHPVTAGGRVDLDGDGRPDRAGDSPLLHPRQRLIDLLPAEDGWGGVWPARVEGGVLTPAGGLHAMGHPAFFGVRVREGVDLTPEPPTVRQAVWMEAAGGRGREGGLHLGQSLGAWHRLTLDASVRAQEPVPHGGREHQHHDLALGHRWLAAPRLTLNQQFRIAQSRRDDITTTLPGLYLPLCSAEEWRQVDLSSRELSWSGRAAWVPSFQHRSEVLLWVRHRRQESAGLELDRVLDRLLPAVGLSSGQRHLFSTRREDERKAWGLRAALEQRHVRGRLQLGLELEQQARTMAGSMSADSLLTTGRHPWLQVEEQTTNLATGLRDRWHWSSALALEGAMDLRYRYYELRRRRVGLFQQSDVPEIGFNQDLLSLDPRLAILVGDGEPRLEVYWQRSRQMSMVPGWWDPGKSVESLWDGPLIAAVAGGEMEGLLPAPLVDQAGLWAWRPGSTLDLRLGLWGRRWVDLPMPFWTARGQALLPGQLTRPLDAREAGGDLRLDWRLPPLRGALQGSWRRTWLEGLWWQPVPDSSQWISRLRHLDKLPGVPTFSLMAEAGASWCWGGWQVEPALTARWQGERDAGNAPGWPGRLPAALRLDGEAACRWQAWSAWRLTLWARNLLDEDAPEAAWLTWAADQRVGRVVTVPAAGRVAGLRVAWSRP
jgi:hypothetical protein